MSTHDPDDDELFRNAMRDVKRMRNVKQSPRQLPEQAQAPKPPAQARFRRADEQEVLRESLLPPADEALLATGDELSFRRPHIPESTLLKLRRGYFSVDGEIDLHGMTGAEARTAMRQFLTDSVARNVRCVRIVHGKGRRSGPRGPVLKNVVNLWLQRTDSVLAFGSARSVDGGSGAVYVLLRGSL